MKNLMKAFGIAVLFSGVVAVANAQTTPAQTAPAKSSTTTAPAKNMDKVVGTDPKGAKVYKGANGEYTIVNGKNVPLPKGTKVTPLPKSTTPAGK